MSKLRADSTLYDVIIIGFGPTGATLANLLAMQGISVLVLDREADLYHLPRAVHFDDETMRVFQTVGIADALSERVHINPGMKFISPEGELLLDWPRPQSVSSNGWHASYRLHQPDLEKLLREKLKTLRSASIRTGCEVTQVATEQDSVTLTARDRSTGSFQQFRGRYVVGCDGARSCVRDAIGSQMEDLGFRERWLVVDLLLKYPRPDLGDHSVQYCDPNRPMTYCRSPRNRRRWEITVKDHESDAEISNPDRVWELLSQWITPEDADLERSAVYTFHSSIAKNWRQNRIMIAGDAAHLTPPFMGQGMCTGIRDVSNLGWKIAACLKGHADESLLETYQAERAPHAKSYIETAMRLGGLINSLDRESALQMTQDGRQMRSISPALGASSILSPNANKDGPIGRLFSQPKLANGQRLDDACGYKFVLLTSETAPQVSFQAYSAQDHPEIKIALDAISTKNALVRPDRHVQATAETDGELSNLIERLIKTPKINTQERDPVS